MATPQDRLDSLLDARRLLEAMAASASCTSELRARACMILAGYPTPDDLHALAAREELLVDLRPRLAPGSILATCTREDGTWEAKNTPPMAEPTLAMPAA